MSLPLVLLHGWGLTPAVWRPLVQALPAMPDLRTPALPGHAGAPAAPPELHAWSDALLPQLPDGTAVLCGWSLGGLIALDLAARHPERVARLILIGATPRFVSAPPAGAADPWPHGLDAAAAQDFVTRFGLDPTAAMQRFTALQALGDGRRRAVSAALAEALDDTGPENTSALADGLRVLTTADLRPAAARIGQPALLLHGDGDALMPVGAAQWLAGCLPRAQLLRFSDCGHAPFVSRPAECAAAIGRFVLD
ncbi:alpha/beta fold hydrolase [Thauera sinica]|uniref:Alpha/beta fold hydrolase n=1 Tax=Thauera sinica TaxID=2665146 RepID=A0ABW1AVD7_9RHOO|nr:alpha/beta fold hydrolase [Thauera sp. K11]ATE62614.1 pimelyl-ACP methyl ester esterase [Thauera sp. K11]